MHQGKSGKLRLQLLVSIRLKFEAQFQRDLRESLGPFPVIHSADEVNQGQQERDQDREPTAATHANHARRFFRFSLAVRREVLSLTLFVIRGRRCQVIA